MHLSCQVFPFFEEKCNAPPPSFPARSHYVSVIATRIDETLFLMRNQMTNKQDF